MLRGALAAVALAGWGTVSACVLGPLALEDRPCPCADGWRCDMARDVCVQLTGRACMTRADCVVGDSCIDGRCVRLDAGPPCLADVESCNGDDDDCDGAIDEGTSLCSLEHATARCTAGTCGIASCQDGYEDCDAREENGCETALGTTSDCGACDDACAGSMPFCAPSGPSARACAASCPSDLDECGGACVDLESDLHHCGACEAPCAPAHGVGRCAAGACSIASCDAPWDDCDDEPANGCEASLESDTRCGSCEVDCTAATAGTCTIGRCARGACVTEPGGAGALCRPAVSLCDVPERCTAAGTCPPDEVAVAGVACRASACGGLDPRELCTGTSPLCPPPCGCEGEPCCAGATECSFGLDCDASACTPCPPTPVTLGGSFPTGAAMSVLRNVTAGGSSITMTDGMATTGTISLGAGITATGSFVPGCVMAFCDWLTRISASGSTITLTSGTPAGGTSMMSTITLVGATATGSVTATPVSPTVPGAFTRVTASGNTITFTDQAMASGTITLTGAPDCTP